MPELISPGPDRFRECLEVLRDGFGTEVDDYGITPENAPGYPSFWDEGRVAEVVVRPAFLLAVEADGRILGCCFVGPSRRDPDAWTLRHLAVTPAARHRGLGQLLVAGAADRARSAGARVVRIGIIGENGGLSDWYHRLGFGTVSSGSHYGTLPFSVDHLELRLGDPGDARGGRPDAG